MVRLPLQFETQASEVSLCSLRISCSLRSPLPLPPNDGRGDAFPSNNQTPSMPCHHRNLNPPPPPPVPPCPVQVNVFTLIHLLAFGSGYEKELQVLLLHHPSATALSLSSAFVSPLPISSCAARMHSPVRGLLHRSATSALHRRTGKGTRL